MKCLKPWILNLLSFKFTNQSLTAMNIRLLLSTRFIIQYRSFKEVIEEERE
jgi:hypothetical protein